MNGFLVLEDGTVFEGESVAAQGLLVSIIVRKELDSSMVAGTGEQVSTALCRRHKRWPGSGEVSVLVEILDQHQVTAWLAVELRV